MAATGLKGTHLFPSPGSEPNVGLRDVFTSISLASGKKKEKWPFKTSRGSSGTWEAKDESLSNEIVSCRNSDQWCFLSQEPGDECDRRARISPLGDTFRVKLWEQTSHRLRAPSAEGGPSAIASAPGDRGVGPGQVLTSADSYTVHVPVRWLTDGYRVPLGVCPWGVCVCLCECECERERAHARERDYETTLVQKLSEPWALGKGKQGEQ